MNFKIIDFGDRATLYIEGTLISRYEPYHKTYRKMKTIIKWIKNARNKT